MDDQDKPLDYQPIRPDDKNKLWKRLEPSAMKAQAAFSSLSERLEPSKMKAQAALSSLSERLEPTKMKAQAALSSLSYRLKIKPAVLGVGMVGIVLLVGVIAFSLFRGSGRHPPRGTQAAAEKIASLKHDVREEPNNPQARLALGHALFAEGKREAAIKNYDQGLSRDKDAGDDKLYDNLASCFGTKEQGNAAAVIARHKLVKMQGRLSRMANDKHYGTRWGAVQTLEKIGKASRAEFVRAWIADLDSSECDVRRRAVEELGKKGDRRALQAIRKAKKKDVKTKKGWLFSSTCLGNRPAEAEKKILAHK